jgi:hypothetical protein
MKMMRWLILTVLFACLLCACAAPVEEPEPTTTVPEETTQITEPVTEEVTEPPTEPPVEVARDMIREGAYTDALDLLADVEGDEAQMLRLRAGLGDVAVGDEIAFGHFEQDNDTENGAELLAGVCEFCRWLKMRRIPYRLESACFDLLDWIMGIMDSVSFTDHGEAYTVCILQEHLNTVEKWLKNHWYF